MLYDLSFQMQMPVYRLCNEMSYDEYLGWLYYFEQKPPGWRDDDRAFKLMQVQGLKPTVKPWDVFPALYRIHHSSEESNKTNMRSLRGSALFARMMSSKDGVILNDD